ncbi:conserved hypothetical protein [Alteracholeplasma palmae J233]|uniref:YhcH/YjgK/YiaL family protein n=1 Tax=Alteracholeplasma palmae (strain ATCC 49389 / J233) TaxID=1318466 RepID=U4KRI7_ALTPJ|nr:YhcH/YjgK/YiaL family protein [Alteracholeplasma palmae]CCV64201.1 conserved hypothetical protein [Alteracholeplasma palmae J233]
MIVDKIKNLDYYASIHPNFKKVVEYIKNNDLLALAPGKHEVDGKEVYLLREDYNPRPLEECYFEGHQNYADIQLVLEGFEYIGYHNVDNKDNVVVTAPYNPEKDVEKYDIKHFVKVYLNQDMFALVLPQDLHMPKLTTECHTSVKKAVFKVKIK